MFVYSIVKERLFRYERLIERCRFVCFNVDSATKVVTYNSPKIVVLKRLKLFWAQFNFKQISKRVCELTIKIFRFVKGGCSTVSGLKYCNESYQNAFFTHHVSQKRNIQALFQQRFLSAY